MSSRSQTRMPTSSHRHVQDPGLGLSWLTSIAWNTIAYLGLVLVWTLFGLAATGGVLGNLWKTLLPLVEQVVTWVFLGLVMLLGAVIATFSWIIQNFGQHIPMPSGTIQQPEDLPDIDNLSREERFNAMARWNASFYKKELTVFVPLQRPVRLVRVQPGWFEEPLVCSTVTTSLVGSLEYVALSYAWGDWDGRSQSLNLDGRDGFRITWNAYNALRRVRARNEQRLIWIDAICIDQSNNREKAGQIQLMGTIYQRAQLVYVYLGACRDSERHGRQVDDDEVTTCRQHMVLDLKDGLQPWLSEPSLPSLWWWCRAWTVQETIVPIDIAVLLGPHSYTWVEICHIATYHGPFPLTMANSLLEVDDLRVSWHGRRQDRGLPLSELLVRTAIRDATRPVDRIFSILAMKSDYSGNLGDIVADYDISAAELDLQTTQYIITQEQNLDIFVCGSWLRHQHFSWAVQFTEQPSSHDSPLRACHDFLGEQQPSACMRLKCQPYFLGYRLVLGYGALFDEIVFTLRPDPPPFAHAADQVAWSALLAPALYQAACNQVDAVAAEIKSASPWSVSRSFSFHKDRDASEWNRSERMSRANRSRKKLSGLLGRGHPRTPVEFTRYARHCAYPGRTFFVTRLGFVGIAYPPDDSFAVTQGQLVVVVDGTRMPLILSSLDRAVEHKPGRLIAPAYISCLMNDEISCWGNWDRRELIVE